MLMPRLQYHLNGYSPEMSIALSMQHQQQHISQLLNTAAAATGIVGDVDALLTVIPKANFTTARMESGRERNLWRTNEIMEVLAIMQEINALDMLNQKAMKSDMVFRKVERAMNLRGFRKKSHIQISTKWKFLKSTYRTSRRNGIIPKMIPQPIYRELHKMLQNSNNNCSGRSTSDCGNSLDGDNSNGVTTVNGNGSANDSQLIISGVEGGYGRGSKGSLESPGAGHESDEENGLAHPIFGFRLGLVKQEPADTGYESANKVQEKEKDSTANIQFQTEIKQEVSDDCDSPAASDSTTPHPAIEDQLEHQQPQHRQSIPEIMILSRRTARPSPAATTPTIATKPNATSTPIAVSTLTPTRPGNAFTPSLTPLPPLRIAPFAKVPPSEMATPISNANLPPPPPLAMNPASCTLRLSSAYSSNSYANVLKGNAAPATTNPNHQAVNSVAYQRKFVPTSPQSLTIAAAARLPVQQQYMRRQEVVLPDLDIASAPHEYRAPQPFYGFPDGPSTSQQAQQMEARKRRLKSSLMMSPTMPPKRMMRAPETLTKPAPRQAAPEFVGADIGDDGLNTSSDEASNSAYREPPQQQQQQQNQQRQQQQQQQQEPPPLESIEREQNYARVLQDMAVSLRQMQREVINEFFKRQMKLAREEHEFQMRQDDMLMKAFKEQSLEFQEMGRQILGSAVKLEKRKKRVEKQERKQILNFKKKQAQEMQKKPSTYSRVLLNGTGVAKPQKGEVKQENENEVKQLMRNIHAQLELTDDEDGEDEPNKYEFDVSDFLQGDGNDIEKLPNNGTLNRLEEEEQNEETQQDEAEGDHTSDPIQIIGH